MALKKTSNSESLSEVVKDIEEKSMAKMHDKYVGEDGEVHGEELLAGLEDPETGEVYTTFDYREMNGLDEEAIAKAEVRANPGRMVNTLIERCVTAFGNLTKKEAGPRKWSELIRNLTAGDINLISFKIRELSKGNKIEFTYKCPHCRKEIRTEVDTAAFDIIPFNGEREVPFSLRKGIKDFRGEIHDSGVVRPINGGDLEAVLPMFKKNEAHATSVLMSRVMKFDDDFVPTVKDIKSMVTGDRDTINDILQDMKFGVELNIDVICPNCGEYLDAEVGTSNFF